MEPHVEAKTYFCSHGNNISFLYRNYIQKEYRCYILEAKVNDKTFRIVLEDDGNVFQSYEMSTKKKYNFIFSDSILNLSNKQILSEIEENLLVI